MGNTNQGSAVAPGTKQRRPSTSEPLGPLEVPIGTKRYHDSGLTPPNSQAKFGKTLLDPSQTEQEFLRQSLQSNPCTDQPEQYTKRCRAGSISLSMEMPGSASALPQKREEANNKVPAVIKWDKDGKDVFISGSFNNWEKKIPLVKSEKNFYTIVELEEGEHEYKFFVDGQWRHNQDEPTVKNSSGTLNNTIKVVKEDFQILQALENDKDATIAVKKMDAQSGHHSSKISDIAEQSEYGRDMPVRRSTDRQTGPPILPPHLLQVILNKDVSEHLEPGMLPEPNHVMLNHLYALSIKDGVMVLSDTSRYKQKFVTTLLYKPIDS
ncbi:5'-AMP-activated protein kinase subunit beta-2-like isoform X1 [Watersipora subatra]|uniref:5'-AMP-activated protein kinase subunit beta-2-like isoform X1 n=1 Tax=Watersipora subatra TaxID=2589382 RepID=UPI00355B1098